MILCLHLEKPQIHLFSMDNNLGCIAHRREDVWESNQNAMDADKLWWKSKVKTEEELSSMRRKQSANANNEEETNKQKRKSVGKKKVSIFLM